MTSPWFDFLVDRAACPARESGRTGSPCASNQDQLNVKWAQFGRGSANPVVAILGRTPGRGRKTHLVDQSASAYVRGEKTRIRDVLWAPEKLPEDFGYDNEAYYRCVSLIIHELEAMEFIEDPEDDVFVGNLGCCSGAGTQAITNEMIEHCVRQNVAPFLSGVDGPDSRNDRRLRVVLSIAGKTVEEEVDDWLGHLAVPILQIGHPKDTLLNKLGGTKAGMRERYRRHVRTQLNSVSVKR